MENELAANDSTDANEIEKLDYMTVALNKLSKKEIIGTLIDLANQNREIVQWLEHRLGTESPRDQLGKRTQEAIAKATHIPRHHRIGHDIDYDADAYEVVGQNFERLVKLGDWSILKPLSIELMSAGSAQVEVVDEGLMSYHIELCLKPVIQRLHTADLPDNEIAKWCIDLLVADRIGCHCEVELNALRKAKSLTIPA